MTISAEKRASLPLKDFAIPERRAYPIDTKKRARNALARVSQHGTLSEQKRVDRAVHRRYPSIEHSKGSRLMERLH